MISKARRAVAWAVAFGCVAACLASCGAASTGGTDRLVGTELDHAVPMLPLVDEAGQATSLAAFRGQVVVLAPFMTLCAEQCPITMGGLIQVHHALVEAGLADRTAIVEVTVDPGRDSPARLRAYSKLIDVPWDHLLTGSAPQIAAFWRFFGVFYAKIPQGKPPDVDWWTHLPETYDVTHQDGLFFLDERGHERLAVIGMANTDRKLPARLRRLLNGQGWQNLAHPGDSWTVRQALDDLGHVLGRHVPSPSS